LGVVGGDGAYRGFRYAPADVFDGPSVRPGMIASWLCGFLLYEWLATSQHTTEGLGFWTDFLQRLHPLDSQVGASLPSFALAFALASAVSIVGRRVRAPTPAET